MVYTFICGVYGTASDIENELIATLIICEWA
jgi:hypothetical protein